MVTASDVVQGMLLMAKTLGSLLCFVAARTVLPEGRKRHVRAVLCGRLDDSRLPAHTHTHTHE